RGRRGPASPPPSAWGGAGPTPATPEPEQLPPPEWADPTAGRRWTGSWRVRPTGTQSALPAPPAGAPASSLLYGEAGAPSRETGAWPAAGPEPQPGEPLPPWRSAAAPPASSVRSTSANPALAPTRAPGAHPALDPARTTGALRATGVTRLTGAVRTAKPITPGTGKARIVLPIVVLTVIGLGFLGLACLWWKTTVFLSTPGALLINIGEILGLLAGYGVVVLVALMARLTPLEKGIGTDRLARWHSIGGRYV